MGPAPRGRAVLTPRSAQVLGWLAPPAVLHDDSEPAGAAQHRGYPTAAGGAAGYVSRPGHHKYLSVAHRWPRLYRAALGLLPPGAAPEGISALGESCSVLEVFWSQTLSFGGVRCSGLYPECCPWSLHSCWCLCGCCGQHSSALGCRTGACALPAEGKASLPALSPQGGRLSPASGNGCSRARPCAAGARQGQAGLSAHCPGTHIALCFE